MGQEVPYQFGWSPLEGDTLRSTIRATVVSGGITYRNGRFPGAVNGMRPGFERA